MTLSPLIRFGTSTWTYEGWQGQVYTRQYAKSKFAQECLGEYAWFWNAKPPLVLVFCFIGLASAMLP